MHGLRILGAAALLALLINGTSAVQAQSDAEAFTLQPGGTATISFEAFCTEFGEVFASGVQVPNALAPRCGSGDVSLRGQYGIEC